MANWKRYILVVTLCTIMATSVSTKGHVKGKRSPRNGNDRDKVARGTIGALLLARLMGQYCFMFCLLESVRVVCRRRMASSVTLPAGGPAAGLVDGRPPPAGPGVWAVGQLTLHGGPVRLRPIRGMPCLLYFKQ